MTAGPDREQARSKYRRLAATYDRRLSTARTFHRRAVAALDPQPGETIIDVGSGTGLSFPLIEERIGRQGRLIGVELSGEMVAQATRRVQELGWGNVELIQSSAEDAEIPEQADAVVFVLTHDIMRSPEALSNMLAAVRPGGRVVAAGSKWAPRWLVPVNAYVWLKARRYITTFDGFSEPWSLLAERVPDLRVQPFLAGAGYIAVGTRPSG